MKHSHFRRFAEASLFVILFAMICRLSPGFSSFWLQRVIIPLSLRLHGLTANVPFPLMEIAAAGILTALALAGVWAILRTLFNRTAASIRVWIRTLAWSAWTIAAIYLIMWYPAYWTIMPEALSTPNTEQLEWLCEQLIDTLNASDLTFSDAEDTLRDAAAIAGDDAGAIKAARYPEWMRALHISGLYSPWTGEAIVDATAPEAALPFTAVHELMHLKGIADEGAANIAAWEICQTAGGNFAASANLWALKYAMEMLAPTDPGAVTRLHEKMEGALARTFRTMYGGNAGTNQANALLMGWLGLSDAASSYPALISHLAAVQP